MKIYAQRVLPILTVFTLGLVVIGFQNCAKASFGSGDASSSSVTAAGGTNGGTGGGTAVSPTCQVTTTAQNLRILFMVDNSASTATTDPSKNYRIAAIKKFLANYGSHTNLTYGFGYFSGTTGYMYDATKATFASSATNAFYSSSGLTTALTAYSSIANSGNTPYKAAFNALSSAISSDANTNSSNYVVVFLSDGAPTDLSSNMDADIATLVKSLNSVVLGKGRLLTVSTVYFGPEKDTAAQSHLELMADGGNGQYVDANGSGSLEVEDIITVPGC